MEGDYYIRVPKSKFHVCPNCGSKKLVLMFDDAEKWIQCEECGVRYPHSVLIYPPKPSIEKLKEGMR